MEDLYLPKPRYIRRGECRQCGACCRNEDCEHMRFIYGKCICMIHPAYLQKETRLPKCPSFPQVPPIIFKTCGYSFFDTWTNKIIKPGEI